MMRPLPQRIGDLLGRARTGRVDTRSYSAVPDDHNLDGGGGAAWFGPGEGYFEVRVNQLQLAAAREWFTRYDPMVLIAVDCVYGSKHISIPYVVGPALFESAGMQVGPNAIIRDIRTVGPLPYLGSPIRIRIVLYKVVRENLVSSMINIAETLSGVLQPFAPRVVGESLSVVSNSVLSALEAVVGLQDAVVPVLAFAKDFGGGNEPLKSVHIALMDRPSGELSPDELWIRNGELRIGSFPGSLSRIVDHDFVHFSVNGSRSRDDVSLLPFYAIWEQALRHALEPGRPQWSIAKSHMVALYSAMATSPDLTRGQAGELLDGFGAELQRHRKRALDLAKLGARPDGGAKEGVEQMLELLDLSEH
ncbi:hypothetical protein [Nonomuraea sp. B5E05]|uniref:hypothetical protein n=1 Tax=Nonomuraea sp. B5E05 TaxID=3153569 RepID=UPI00325FE4E7